MKMSKAQTISTLESRVKHLSEEKRVLTDNVGRLRAHIAAQPGVIDQEVAQRIVDARDEVEYRRRRLEDAQDVLNKLMRSLGLQEVSIQIVAPTKTVEQLK